MAEAESTKTTTPPSTETASAEPVPAEPAKPAARRRMRREVRWVIAAAVVILLFVIQNWAAGRSEQRARQEAWAQALDAVATASVATLLQRNTERTRKLATDLVQSGAFKSVSFTDPTGKVTITTDASLASSTFDELKRPVVASLVRRERESVVGYRSIAVGGDNVFAGLRVEFVQKRD